MQTLEKQKIDKADIFQSYNLEAFKSKKRKNTYFIIFIMVVLIALFIHYEVQSLNSSISELTKSVKSIDTNVSTSTDKISASVDKFDKNLTPEITKFNDGIVVMLKLRD